MDRYEVTQAPDWSKWLILDRHMWGYCSLPGDEQALEWTSRHAAEAWLNQCYRLWESGKVPAPRQWKPLEPGVFNPWVVPNTLPAMPGDPWTY